MTVIDRLRSAGAPEAEAQKAASAIGALLPVNRDVRITDELLDAARAGNVALVVMLLAEEVKADPDEITALEAFDRDDDGVRYSGEQIRSELGLL
jgi:hypothetical protein